ncbi:MAG: SH3 domain-containing protein [Treponema sp.]|jgi:hypothetical protein|nr:SH3 domain-containing protein [Treponema sp.]
MKKLFAALFGVSLLMFSCLIPEKFTCAINVDKYGAYSIDFKGTILFYAALEEIEEEGSVSADTDRQIQKVFAEWSREEPRIKKYEYRNAGRAYVEFYQRVTDGSSVDLSDEFGLPLRIDVYPDEITITEEAADGETARLLTGFVQLGYKLDGRINITSELPIINPGRQKVGRKYVVFGPQVINQTFKAFPSLDEVITIGMNPPSPAPSAPARTSSGGAIADAIRAFINASGEASSAPSKGAASAGSNNRTAAERTPAAKQPTARPTAQPPETEEPDANAFTPTHKIVTNDGTKLRLRARPSTNGAVITSLKYGSLVQVLELGDSFIDDDGNGGNWVYIATPAGNKGWCFGGYLKPLR